MTTTAHGVSIVRTCPVCGATNNIRAAPMPTSGLCHACKAAWRLAEPISVDEASFAAITRNTRLPIVIVFCDARSAPCRRITPDVHELARETSGQAIFLKVDTEQHPQIEYEFSVRSLPHLVILRDRQVMSEQAGAVDQGALRRWLCTYVDPSGARPLCPTVVVRLMNGFREWLSSFTDRRADHAASSKAARA
jgi:thioredoxin 2